MYCGVSFSSDVASFRNHINGMKHMINVHKYEKEQDVVPPIRKRDRSPPSDPTHNTIGKALVVRTVQLIEEGKYDDMLREHYGKFVDRIWHNIDTKEIERVLKTKILKKFSDW